jgi:hypothetical protein
MNNKNYLNEESDLLSSIKNWNIRFPFDLKWRRKYKIPFGSKAHRKMSLLDIKFDIEEDNEEELEEDINADFDNMSDDDYEDNDLGDLSIVTEDELDSE